MKRTLFGSVICFFWTLVVGLIHQPLKAQSIQGSYQLDNLLIGKQWTKKSHTTTEISFGSNGTIQVYAGCNQIRGKFSQASKGRLTIEAFMSTKMACQDPTEYHWLEQLRKVTRFQRKGSRLLLYQNQKLLMSLRKKANAAMQKAAEPETLQGKFVLLKIKNQQQTWEIGNFSKTSLEISENQLSATVGCNRIHGELVYKEQNLQPMRLIKTEMYCEDLDDLERLLCLQLESCDSIQRKAVVLSFYKQGTLLMEWKLSNE